MADTVYDVRVVYSVGGNASREMQRITRQAQTANQATSQLRSTLAILGGGALFIKGKQALLDYNAEIDQMKIGMTAVIQMQMGKPFQEANVQAQALFNTFQQLAKESPATTKDFVDMASQVLPAVAAAKGSLDDVKGITAGAITAGTAMGFGKRLDIVAIEMRQMVQGVVTQRDQLAMQLLSSQGISNSKFNNMTPEKRIELMRKVFNHPAILKAAREQGQAYMGQMSTLKDVIQIALGQVGHPLMMSLTEEAKKINEWMAKNPKAIAQFARQFGGALKDGFGYVKSVIKFVTDNRDVLLSIAKAFLVFKGAQFVGSGLNGLTLPSLVMFVAVVAVCGVAANSAPVMFAGWLLSSVYLMFMTLYPLIVPAPSPAAPAFDAPLNVMFAA
jgi:hypothetical protein